jgi:hypothetical protein
MRRRPLLEMNFPARVRPQIPSADFKDPSSWQLSMRFALRDKKDAVVAL